MRSNKMRSLRSSKSTRIDPKSPRMRMMSSCRPWKRQSLEPTCLQPLTPWNPSLKTICPTWTRPSHQPTIKISCPNPNQFKVSNLLTKISPQTSQRLLSCSTSRLRVPPNTTLSCPVLSNTKSTLFNLKGKPTSLARTTSNKTMPNHLLEWGGTQAHSLRVSEALCSQLIKFQIMILMSTRSHNYSLSHSICSRWNLFQRHSRQWRHRQMLWSLKLFLRVRSKL